MELYLKQKSKKQRKHAIFHENATNSSFKIFLGKEEVTSSNLVNSSRKMTQFRTFPELRFLLSDEKPH